VPWTNLPPPPSEAALGDAARATPAAGESIADLPALPSDGLPPPGRMTSGATDRSRSTVSAASAAHPANPFADQVSGAAAARLFAPPARLSALPSLDAPSQASQPTGGFPVFPADQSALSGEPAHPPTLTQQMRAMQPPDVARQALNELSVLAGELVSLARDLEQSGLAGIRAGSYFDAVRRYGELARQAWLSVAAERLEQDGASADYRQRVVGIARDITRLRRESEVAASNEQFPLPRRRPFLWRSRARIISRGLLAWQTALGAPADPQRMGLALFDLRGALNRAGIATFEFSLLSLLSGVALTLAPLSGLAAGLAYLASALTQQPVVAASFALVTVLALMLWAILLLLTSRGRVTLSETLAGACFSETRSTCNGGSGSRFVAALLRIWWVLIGGVGALLTLGALAGSVYALLQAPQLAPLVAGLPQTPIAGLWQVAGLLAVVTAPAAAVASATLFALALPALLVSALRLAGEMAGSRRWIPAARRYALVPALATLAWLTGGLVALAWLVANGLGLAQMTLASIPGADSPVQLTVSERAPLLALALALPYLALIELPFRLGLGSWRRAWLRDLRSRRTTIEAHVRRLSAPDPRTGAPDTSAETLRAMQYDLVLLQFYTARITEAERAIASPLGLGGTLALLITIVAGAALLDGGAHALALAQALSVRLTP